MLVILEYGMGNVGSVLNMLRRVGADACLSSDPEDVRRADKLILPGVGAFDAGMRNLKERGLLEVLEESVLRRGVPLLGLCLGMQLMTRGSEEGTLPGLGWLPADTVRFQSEGVPNLKVPHMGWNSLRATRRSALLRDLQPEARFYFVHSYHVICDDPDDVAAWTFHGYQFAAVVDKGRLVGTQFHPEKSHRFGMQLLHNFVTA